MSEELQRVIRSWVYGYAWLTHGARLRLCGRSDCTTCNYATVQLLRETA